MELGKNEEENDIDLFCYENDLEENENYTGSCKRNLFGFESERNGRPDKSNESGNQKLRISSPQKINRRTLQNFKQ